MKSVIVFRDGRRVNLAGGVDPEMYAELEATQGRGSRKEPLLFCGGCLGGVYIKHGSIRRDELFGAHFDAGNCADDLTVRKSTMTPAHRRKQEYIVRAGTSAGLPSDTEVPTSARTRVDAVVGGHGFEVQLSALTAGAAVRRTGRSMAAGLKTVTWSADGTSAAWIGKVPGYQWLDNGQFREEMPPPRSIRCRGLYTFREERSYGRWVPVPEPLTVLADEVIVRIARGNIRPVLFGGHVQLVRADGIALYEQLTGRSLEPFAGHAPARTLAPAVEDTCARPRIVIAHSAVPVVKPGICNTPNCGQPARLYPAGWRCDNHKPGAKGERN